MTHNEKLKRDKQLWIEWLNLYCDRIQQEFSEKVNDEDFWIDRTNRMNQVNPEFVLRNHVLQECIKEAEKGNFDLINQLLQIIQSPFNVPKDIRQKYCNWFRMNDSKIYVSCSS